MSREVKLNNYSYTQCDHNVETKLVTITQTIQNYHSIIPRCAPDGVQASNDCNLVTDWSASSTNHIAESALDGSCLSGDNTFRN